MTVVRCQPRPAYIIGMPSLRGAQRAHCARPWVCKSLGHRDPVNGDSNPLRVVKFGTTACSTRCMWHGGHHHHRAERGHPTQCLQGYHYCNKRQLQRLDRNSTSKHIRTRILLRTPRLTASIQTRLRIPLAPAPAPDILGPHAPCLTFSRLLQRFYRTLLRRARRILEVL